MKSSNKSSILTGIVLLLLAALFSISLIIQPLDYGFNGSARNSFFFILGSILFTAYGFSSILIPLFLFIAGLSCFATKWTSQKTMRLITAIIPFFTAVLTEKVCRSIIDLGLNSSATVKIIIALVTGIMLIIIEILGAGVIAESVNQKIFYKDGKSIIKNDNEKDDIDNNETSAQVKTIDKKITTQEQTSNSNDFSYEPIKKNTAFDKALSEISINNSNYTPINSEKDISTSDQLSIVAQEEKTSSSTEKTTENTVENTNSQEKNSETQETIDESFESLVNDAENIYSDDIPSIEEYENIDSKLALERTKTSEQTEQPKEEIKTASETEKQQEENNTQIPDSDKEDDEPVNPATIITQEEYAALINPDILLSEEEPDDLEWNNLPPVPETLPPEYLDDDPTLEFPPKDVVENNPEAKHLFEDAVKAQNTNALSQDSDNFEQSEDKIDKTEVKNETEETETPYSAAKFIDSVVHPNPAYPFGIKLHENTEEKPIQKTKTRPEAPKYPTKISLDENAASTESNLSPSSKSNSTPSIKSQPVQKPTVTIIQSTPEPEDDAEYEEDITLPEPDYNNMNDSYNPNDYQPLPADIIHDYEIQDEIDNYEENKLDPDFFDIDINNQPEDEDLSDDIEEIPDELKTTNTVFHQIYTQENKNKGFSAPVSDVFSDMEADIRKSSNIVSQNNQLTQTQEIFSDSSELNPNANSAKNLTADELTDFFNAQQTENTPITHEIEGNLPDKNSPTANRAGIKGPYIIPSDLLTAYKDDQYWIIDDKTKEASINLKQTLAEFNIDAEIIGIKKGPVVTMFELLPAPGVKLSKIVALQDNIALSLAASSVRIVAPIPGKQAVGIEVPNKERSIVSFREIIEMDLPEYSKMAVPVVLGKDILGKAQLIDLVKTPHMLIAGATGSGKSVCVNSLILSILYKRSYKDVKLILVDPKVVELKLYNNIPHLLTPVITEPKKALQALQYCLCEMERRYALLDGLGVRDISSYNQRIKERDICTEKLPYIVVIIDEFADLMATSGKELESIVARLTAMSRAVGIHLVLATQRPSVNVITGLIKANIPSRIAFMVASRTDSNIIIDSVGAEKLLGRGDMLYASAVDPYPVRIQGTFVSDSEVENVVEYVKQFGEPEYIDEEIFVDDDDDGNENVDLFGNSMGEDPLYDQALEIVVQAGKASASYIQRRLKIGYNRAARLVEEMEERGIVGPANGSKPREIIHLP